MNNGHGGLPCGFKFKPKNSELIWYLLHKVNGSPLSGDHFIIDCDLYDGKDSWKRIFDSSPAGTTRLYFFTKLKKVTEKRTPTGGNNNRRTGGGTWKETQNCGTVYDPNSNPKKPIGNKRSFKFAPNRDVAAEFTGRWLMDEFSLDSRFVRQNMDEYVVCCIKREEDRKSKLHCPNTVQLIRNSEQEDCRNSGSANSINDTTTATTLDSENGAMNIGDPNLCFTQDDLPALFDPNLCFTQDDLSVLFDPNLCFNPDELLANLYQISTAPECQLATTLDGPSFTDSNSSTYTSRLLMDTPFVPNQSFQEKAATSLR